MNYSNIYENLIRKRRISPLDKSRYQYTEVHHVNPVCLGGDNESSNLIRLTAREHFIAHRLLSKIHPNSEELLSAVWIMCHTREGVKIGSKAFEILREAYSKRTSALTKLKWQSEEFKSEQSRRAKEQWECPRYQRLRSTIMKDFHKSKCPRPWMNPNATKTKEVWSLARILFNEQMNPYKFCRIYNESKNESIIYKMREMMDLGWDPNLDDLWLGEFDKYGFR